MPRETRTSGPAGWASFIDCDLLYPRRVAVCIVRCVPVRSKYNPQVELAQLVKL